MVVAESKYVPNGKKTILLLENGLMPMGTMNMRHEENAPLTE